MFDISVVNNSVSDLHLYWLAFYVEITIKHFIHYYKIVKGIIFIK